MSKRYEREHEWIIDNNKRKTKESIIVYDEEWNTLDDLCELLNQQAERIAELEEQLKNAIVPKFKIGQEVWWVSSKSQIAPVRVVIGDFSYFGYRKHKILYDGDMKLNFYEGLPECQLFATKEEAQAKLEELKGE